ncbi:hypothetical protein [Arthrobacter sp. OAP107]|uniref:hypothetical protein n=1 Tax=Arthrobacter sp. OAP107 TaxID=3156445 RepID=UPI00339B1E25
MDPSTIMVYVLAYLATMGIVFLMLLPAIISLVLLLLVDGAIQLVILILRLAALGLFRSAKALTGRLIEKFRSPGNTGRLAHH